MVADSKQTFSNQYRSSKPLAVMDNIETLHKNRKVVAESVGFRFEAELFKSVPKILGLAVMDNMETFHHKRMVASETVGFMFEAHFFKSVSIIIGFGCHVQH